MSQKPTSAQRELVVSTYTRGIVRPGNPILGPVADGGTLRVGTPPGCWGPMITPKFQGGHEVSQPVAVEGAQVGDAVAIHIQRMEVTSLATSSGVMAFVDGRYLGDPFVAKLCPSCGTVSPPSHIEGIGDDAVHCDVCGAEVNAFRFTNGYVIVLDKDNNVSLTVDKAAAERLAPTPKTTPACPSTPSSTRSCRWPAPTSSALRPTCSPSSATSAPPRRRTCRTPTMPATSAASWSTRPTPTP